MFTSTEGQLCLASATGNNGQVCLPSVWRGKNACETVKVWNPVTGDLLRTFSAEDDTSISSLSSAFIGPEKQVCLAGVSFDKTILMWNASTGNLLNTIRTGTHMQCVTVFTDSRGIACLATGTSEMSSDTPRDKIKLWE